jgi:NADH:ubiquinone oxidoreductase subunit 3 (subunit A)
MENLQHSQIAQYLPVLMLLIVAVGFAAGVLVLSVLVGYRSKHTRAKDTAYECGKDPIGEGSGRFSVKFYLVAMLFILFDIEVVLLPRRAEVEWNPQCPGGRWRCRKSLRVR